MSTLREFAQYAKTFRTHATQLNDYRTIREWFNAGIYVELSWRFAQNGYLPTEGLQLLEAVKTADTYDSVHDDLLDVRNTYQKCRACGQSVGVDGSGKEYHLTELAAAICPASQAK